MTRRNGGRLCTCGHDYKAQTKRRTGSPRPHPTPDAGALLKAVVANA